MISTKPRTATVQTVKEMMPLGQSNRLFLSAYLATEPSQTSTEGSRLRLSALLKQASLGLEDTSWQKSFEEDRKSMERMMRSLRPGGRGLFMLSSIEAKEEHAIWMPDAVPDSVRFGRGAYLLPLIDLLDEWEPIAFALVEKDKARVMVLSAARIEEVIHTSAEVPGKHKVGGGTMAYRGPDLARDASGGAALRFQRHTLVHIRRHLKEVAHHIGEAYKRHKFRRLILGGPTEAVTLFKPLLPVYLANTLVGEIPVDAHASDEQVRKLVLGEAEKVERSEEIRLVENLITKAQKNGRAVIGLEPTLNALNNRTVYMLIMGEQVDWTGRYCPECDVFIPSNSIVCLQCKGKTFKVDLWKELPSFALRHNVKLEVVHGNAASILYKQDGICALLKLPQR